MNLHQTGKHLLKLIIKNTRNVHGAPPSIQPLRGCNLTAHKAKEKNMYVCGTSLKLFLPESTKNYRGPF